MSALSCPSFSLNVSSLYFGLPVVFEDMLKNIFLPQVAHGPSHLVQVWEWAWDAPTASTTLNCHPSSMVAWLRWAHSWDLLFVWKSGATTVHVIWSLFICRTSYKQLNTRRTVHDVSQMLWSYPCCFAAYFYPGTKVQHCPNYVYKNAVGVYLIKRFWETGPPLCFSVCVFEKNEMWFGAGR